MDFFLKHFSICLLVVSASTAAFAQSQESKEEWTAATPFKVFYANLDQGIKFSKKTELTTGFQVSGSLPAQTQIFVQVQGMPKYKLINPSLPLSEDNISYDNADKCTQEVDDFSGKKIRIPVSKFLVLTSSGISGKYDLKIPTTFIQEGCPSVTQKITFYLKYNFNKAEVQQMVNRLKAISPTNYVALYDIHYSGLYPSSDGDGFIILDLMPEVADEFTSPLLNPDTMIDAKFYSPEGKHSLSWYNLKFTDAPRQNVAFYSFSQKVIDGKQITINVMNAGKAPPVK